MLLEDTDGLERNTQVNPADLKMSNKEIIKTGHNFGMFHAIVEAKTSSIVEAKTSSE